MSKSLKIRIKYSLLTLLLLCTTFSVQAQKATVRATIEPSTILIGEQALIEVEVIAPKDANVGFAMYPDSIIKGIEVIGMVKPDTTMSEVMAIKQKYIVTSFDSTLYNIPHMAVFVDNDTLYTNSVGLNVTSPQLSDSTLVYLEAVKQGVLPIEYDKLGVADIKDIQEVRWTIFDTIYDFVVTYLTYVLIVVLIVVGVGLAIFFLTRKKKKGYYFKPEIILPPHVVAISELDKLKGSKIWQQGLTKEYYTRLTDILREYIDRRYGVDAPEMTSDEIMEALRRRIETRSPQEGLAQILQLADLVKFAKYVPLASEDDLSMVNAYLFINQTKIEEVVPLEEQAKKATDEGRTASSEISNEAKVEKKDIE